MLRTRNQVVVTARSSSAERRHALTIVVHVREQDLEHFNRATRVATDDGEAKRSSDNTDNTDSSSSSVVNYMEVRSLEFRLHLRCFPCQTRQLLACLLTLIVLFVTAIAIARAACACALGQRHGL